MIIQEIISGRTCSLFAIAGDNDCPVHDFLSDLQGKDHREFAKIMKILADTAESGPPKRNEQKCRYIRELKVFEFKTTGGVRIMAFWDQGNLIICSHGFMKKSRKTPPNELQRVRAARQRYQNAKSVNQIIRRSV
ncbi:MAG: type II toxin-antitoxin system RelE/ParE family toxin [Verrucomicrobia bacterium]|nr:type II toxin-antitoxin system RelE/ParE family toxin [Verrucomicrobiota bacterium]